MSEPERNGLTSISNRRHVHVHEKKPIYVCMSNCEAHAEKWFITGEILVKQSDLRAISPSPVL